MKLLSVCVLAGSVCCFLSPAEAATPQLVPWANRSTVDTDGDTVPDLVDNAPGIANNQADTDTDGIGDAVDPTPNNSNPALGDPGFGTNGPPFIVSGSSFTIDYLMMLQTPPGAWGYIDLDFGGDSIYDATYFGPLTATYNQLVIPPNTYEIPGLYSQNIVGTYQIYGKAYGPGMHSQFETITTVNVVPEPATIALAALGLIACGCRRRARAA